MLQPSQLNPWLHATYGIDATCELFRSYTNDVFLVHAGDARYVLKLYGVGWRTEANIQYEVALLDHLARKGLRVANTLPGVDGQIIHQYGDQYAVLFEYAAGHKPQRPFTTDLYVLFGQSIARMHTLSDDFATQHQRKPLDLALLIDAPLEFTLPLMTVAEDRQFLERIAAQIRQKMASLNSLDWGVIHGDATLDNLHITDDGQIVLYDFDMGGLGWRAADLQGWAKNNDEYAERWVAYKQGYASIRELRAIDLEAAPYLAVAWQLWGMQIDLEHALRGQSREQCDTYFAERMAEIRQQAQMAMT